MKILLLYKKQEQGEKWSKVTKQKAVSEYHIPFFEMSVASNPDAKPPLRTGLSRAAAVPLSRSERNCSASLPLFVPWEISHCSIRCFFVFFFCLLCEEYSH